MRDRRIFYQVLTAAGSEFDTPWQVLCREKNVDIDKAFGVTLGNLGGLLFKRLAESKVGGR